MLGNLLGEIARRRLWPIPVAALLVTAVALLAFMKPAPPDAPAASAPAPAPAAAGALPERAQRLLTADDAPADVAPVRRRDASDPFEPPASHGGKRARKRRSGGDAAPSKGAAGSDAAPPVGTKENPIPVVIANAGAGVQPQVAGGAPIVDDATTVSTSAVTGAAVDVRFGAAYPARLHRAIARTQTFAAGGRIVAIFVKYSPARDKAVFAISPRTLVTGDVACRRKQGVCRYVDIPAGGHVRLTTLAADGTVVSRRLDVARIDRSADGRSAAAVASAPLDGACLLRRMLALARDASAPAIDACRS